MSAPEKKSSHPKRILPDLPPFAIYGMVSGVIILCALISMLFFVEDGAFVILKGVIGDRSTLFSLTGVTAAVCAVNILSSWAIFRKDRVAYHILGALAVIIPAFIVLKVATVFYFW
jgi:hypothetical protein